MKRLLNIMLVLLMTATCVMAQNTVTISGTVTDTHGQPVTAATIAAEGTTRGAYSDDKGRYTLQLPQGRYTLQVTFVGMRTARRTIDARKDTRADFTLEESSVSLGAVNIYGKTHAQKTREGLYSVNALDVKPLASSVSSLNEIVNRTAGVKIREEGGVGSDFDLSVNGMSGNSVRYFIDGMPLDSKGSGVTLANLPVNIIDRIEIYKGVVPASLGADALGGAVNIITSRSRRNYLDVSYGTGSFHTHKADLNAQFTVPGTSLRIRPSAGVNYSKNDYMMRGVEVWDEAKREYVGADRRRFHDGYLSLLAQVEAGFSNQPWADECFVSASWSKVDKELQTGSIQSKVYGMAERQSEAWSVSARYAKRNFITSGLQLSASVSHTWDHSLTIDTAFRKYDWNGNYIESSRNEITGRDRSMRHYRRPMTVARAGMDYAIGSHHSLSFNYLLNRTLNDRYDDIDTEFEPSKDILTKHILGLACNQTFFSGRMSNTYFLKDYINRADIRQSDLYWITGARDIESSYSKNYVGYGTGTRFRFAEAFALKASFEHSVRLPLARELLGNGTTVYANLRLKPENSNNFNAGTYGTIASASGAHSLYYEANGFYRNVKDYIHAVVSEAEGMMQYQNVSSIDIKGIEGEMRYRWKDLLQATVNCSWQDARDKQRYTADGKPSVTFGNRVPNRPWLFGNAELNLTLHGIGLKDSRLTIGYHYQYVHWFFLTWEGYGSLDSKSRIPTQNIHGAVASYSWHNGRYNISAECNNIFDSKAYDNYMLQKPGRSFFCKFRLFIN